MNPRDFHDAEESCAVGGSARPVTAKGGTGPPLCCAFQAFRSFPRHTRLARSTSSSWVVASSTTAVTDVVWSFFVDDPIDRPNSDVGPLRSRGVGPISVGLLGAEPFHDSHHESIVIAFLPIANYHLDLVGQYEVRGAT